MSLTDELRREYAPGVPFVINVTDQRVPDLLEDSARRHPDRVALDFFSRTTTYRELLEAARRGAGVLARAGVRPGDRVALVMPNCPQHVIAVFATMMLGAIAVEHNPLAPSAELRAEFDRHGARVVVAWENAVSTLDFLGPEVRIFGVSLAAALPLASRTLLRLPLKAARARRAELSAPTPDRVQSWDREIARSPQWQGSCPSRADDVALLIHTGGTTGVPKAAALSHRNLCANVAQDIAWVPELHEAAEVFDCVLPLFHAFGFGVSMLAGIRLAATLALFPKFDVAMVLTSQKRLPCTFFVGVPPMFERLLQGARELGSDLTSMRFSLSGAMALDRELAAKWEGATGGLIIEGFGMTEGSPVLIGNPLSPLRRPGALGLPFPSTEIRLVDPENPDRDVAPGEIGEILARGPQVFSGYWEAPAETAEALHDGWLHTGDLAHVDDGFLVMADRRKEMINAQGFNVYPSQVEDAVRSMPGVHDIAVVGVPAGARGESVVAAIVLEAGASVTLEDIREWAGRTLAHYALPRQLVVVNELPRSQIGKVMRRRVREEILGVQGRVADLAEQAQTAVTTAAAEAAERLQTLREEWEDRSGDAHAESSGEGADETGTAAPAEDAPQG